MPFKLKIINIQTKRNESVKLVVQKAYEHLFVNKCRIVLNANDVSVQYFINIKIPTLYNMFYILLYITKLTIFIKSNALLFYCDFDRVI